MKLTKCIFLCAVFSLFATTVYSRDSKSKLQPDFSAVIEGRAGFSNVSNNKTLKEIPWLSSSVSSLLNLNIKGSFSRAAQWAEERTDGVIVKDGIGYDAGVSLNLAKIYELQKGVPSYTSSSDANKYALIQPMIDWYEKNMARYGLPKNPCDTPDGSAWPTTSYGMKSNRYQFIKGSTVERVCDVAWDAKKWGDAQALYEEIRSRVQTKIDSLYFAESGDVKQFQYSTFKQEGKILAEAKQKLIDEFKKVSSGQGTADKWYSVIPSAYISVTNIANILDLRVDFAGKKLSVGNMITSKLASTIDSGAAFSAVLRNSVLSGFQAELSVGIAGGEKQVPENYDTLRLDYQRGVPAELAVKANVQYTKYFETLSSELRAQGQFIMTDLLVSPLNFAVDINASWNTFGFINYGADAEALLVYWADRYALAKNQKSHLAYSFAGGGHVGIFGAKVEALAKYKSENFTSMPSTAQNDRFLGVSALSDYNTANKKQALMLEASASFNPQYFFPYDIVTLKAGVRTFMYNNNLALNGLGFFADFDVSIEDLTRVPLRIYAGFDYYKNSKLLTWADMSTLPKRSFIDYSSWKIGTSFEPVRDVLELAVEYISSPSLSRREKNRISSVSCIGRISL